MTDVIEVNPFDPLVPDSVRATSDDLYSFLRNLTENLRLFFFAVQTQQVAFAALQSQVSTDEAKAATPPPTATDSTTVVDISQTQANLDAYMAATNDSLKTLNTAVRTLVTQVSQLPSPSDFAALVASNKTILSQIVDSGGVTIEQSLADLGKRLDAEIALRTANQTTLDAYLLQQREDHNDIANQTNGLNLNTGILFDSLNDTITQTNSNTQTIDSNQSASGGSSGDSSQPIPSAQPKTYRGDTYDTQQQ